MLTNNRSFLQIRSGIAIKGRTLFSRVQAASRRVTRPGVLECVSKLIFFTPKAWHNLAQGITLGPKFIYSPYAESVE